MFWRTRLLGEGEPGVSLGGSLEDAGVAVTSEVSPLNLADCAHRVNDFEPCVVCDNSLFKW